MTIAVIILVWCVLSVPFAILVGRFIKRWR